MNYFLCFMLLLYFFVLFFKNCQTKWDKSRFLCKRCGARRGLSSLFGAMWSKLLLDTCDFALRVVARTKQVLHFRKRCQKQDSPLPGRLNYPTRGSLKRRRAHFL